MGAQLVGRAIAFSAVNDLKPNEFRLLVFMAHTALDTDQPPRYYGSRELSAYGLGRMLPDDLDIDERQRAERESAFQLVKVATQGLVKCGAIERLQRGRTGQRAMFAITFRGKESVPLKGNDSLPLRGKESVPQGVSDSYPQGTIYEPQKELGPRTPRFTDASHLQPVDNSDERKSA